MTALALTVGMMVSLGQFTETPAIEWIKLAEALTKEFNLQNVSVRVNIANRPTSMRISYLTRTDSKFNLSVQNAEMENVANFAVKNYRGRDLTAIDQVQVTRSETHGSGCFQQTYVATFMLPNPIRTLTPRRLEPFTLPPQEK